MREPKIGQVIHLVSKVDNHLSFKTHVMELTDNHYFISRPVVLEGTSAQEPHQGEVYVVEYKSTDGSLCRFESNMEEFHLGQNSFWRLHRPKEEDIDREQRREFVRVPTNLPVRIELKAKNDKPTFVDTFMRDISGGGMAVLIPAKAAIKVGDTIHGKFTLANNGFTVDVNCYVVRIGEVNDTGYCTVSLQFLNLKESVRQRIIQYTFWRQRMLV